MLQVGLCFCWKANKKPGTKCEIMLPVAQNVKQSEIELTNFNL